MGLGILAIVVLISSPGPPRNSTVPDKAPMPTTLQTETEFPLWVDSRVTLTASGQLNELLFHRASAGGVRELLATPATNGCIQAPKMSTNRIHAPPRGTVEDSVRNNEFTLLAKVTGRSFGFYAGDAGQLLRLSPEMILKGDKGSDVYYAFSPFGEFTVGGLKICKSDDRYAPPPQIGEEVFIFTSPPVGQLLLVEDPGDLFVVAASGKVILPPKYNSAEDIRTLSARHDLSRDELVDQIRATKDAGRQ